MHVKTFTSINDVDQFAWNSLVARNRLICRHEYLRAIEASRINDCRYFYPVVYDGDEIVAHTCLYFISTELDLFAKGLVKRVIELVRGIWPGFMILRSVECGTPVALGNTISLREGTNKTNVLMRIVNETERVAEEINVKVLLFRDFCEEELNFYDHLQDVGYTRIRNLPCARMQIRWKSFDEYLESMRSQYRSKLLAQMRRSQEAGVTVEVVESFSRHAEDLTCLWRNSYDHATEYKREVLLKDFFENIDYCLGDRSSVIIAGIDGKLIGFLLLLFDDDTLIPLFCGLDYSSSRDSGIYFNLFYKAIAIAIDRHMKDIDFGITTIPPKIDLGAIVTPLHMYMKHANPFLRKIIPSAFDMMTPQTSLRSRKVFKK